MTIAFTTTHLEQRDRIPYWVDVASKAFFDHGFNAKPSDFIGRLDARKLDSLMLTRCECSPCAVTRTRRDVSRDGIDGFTFWIPVEGRFVMSQDNRTVVGEPGTVLLQDTGRPQEVEFLEQTTSIFLSIPRQRVQARIANRDTDRVLSTDLPLAGIASEFVRSLFVRIDAIEPDAHHRLAEQALELVALAFTDRDGGSPLSATRAGALRRLKGEIEKRLSDPGLKPSDVAAAAGISVRYANLLLAAEGFSLERYIVHQRLQHCRRMLEDPRQGHRMIGEIAFAWGFSDHSHFTRRFRAAFGMTPGDCRELSRAAGEQEAS